MLDDWHFLLFSLPTLIGLCLIFSLAFGVGDLDGHLHGDLEGHTDHDALSALGFGRTPLIVTVVSLLLIYGCTGLVFWIAKQSPVLSVPASMLASYMGTRALTRFFAKRQLMLETNSVTAEHFLGKRATVTLASNGEGTIQVTLNNDLYQFRFRSEDTVKRGSIVRIVDMDEGTGIYNVCLEP